MHDDPTAGADGPPETARLAAADVCAAAPVGLVVFDAQGQVVTANPAAHALLATAPDAPGQVAGRHRLGPGEWETLRTHLGRVVRTGSPHTCELRLALPGGATLDLLVQSAPLPGGPPGHVCAALVDVSGLRGREPALAEALARSEALAQARSTFLARFGHELRSALASMVGFADLLRQHAGPEHHELADLIRLSGRHLLDTLRSVVDLARLDAHPGEVERLPVDVAARVRDRVLVMQPPARERGLALACHAAAPVVALVNPTFLDRIVHNLLENALKYTHEGRVDVHVVPRDGRAWLYVSDTGIGIAPPFLPRLFEPFSRERSGADGPEGTGLGLAIARSLAERMGGRVYATSTRGAGTTFTAHFPLAPPGPEQQGAG